MESVPSARDLAYKAFFQPIMDRLREDHAFTKRTRAQPKHFSEYASGVSGIEYGVVFGHDGLFRAELYIDRPVASWNKQVFDRLVDQKIEIERAFGSPLDWQRLDHRQACRIRTFRLGTIEDSSEQLDELQAWAIANLLRLKEVFGPRLLEV